MARFRNAPTWEVQAWLNTEAPLDLASLRGRVVVLLAFQMLCPGCAQFALPQLRRVSQAFDPARVAAVGLHTVFENQGAQSPEALAAFLRDRGLDFPVGVDRPDDIGDIPITMGAYGMQGTPTLVLIDRVGRIRQQTLGHVPDLNLGASIMALVMEPDAAADA
jgi:peroxiredoxin